MNSSPRADRSYEVGEHRSGREAGRLVYPVISRRSGGLSLGINLFPDAKDCPFDCRNLTIPGTKPNDQFMDNVLASPQGAITGEKFERFEVSFVGAGDTLAAALAALLAAGAELTAAVGEALAFLDQALDDCVAEAGPAACVPATPSCTFQSY